MFCRDDDTGTTADKCIHYAMVLNLVLHMLTQGDSFESLGPDFVGRYVADTRASFAKPIELLWLFFIAGNEVLLRTALAIWKGLEE